MNELTLLACCMLSQECVDKAIELGITPQCFTDIENKVLWEGMLDRRKKSLTCDLVWATDYVKTKTGKNKAVEFSMVVSKINHISEYASAVECMLKDYRQQILSKLLADGLTELEVGEPVLVADTLLADLTKFRSDTTQATEIDVLDNIRKKLDKRNQVRTGIPRLTWMLKGIERGVLITLGGFTSHGKTQLALNIALEVAKQEQPITYFSTEMDETSLTMRLATIVSGVNPSIASSLTEIEKDAFITDVQNIGELPIHLCKTLSLSNIRLAIQKRKSLLYVVDYIQMIYPDKPIDNEVKRLGHIARELEIMSKEYNVCILATSQFHRPTRKDGVAIQPTLSSFRGSGEIEESTDVGVLIYYPYMMASFDKKKEMEDNGKDNEVELCVSKNRIHGLTGVVNLTFDRRTMRFKEQGDDDSPFD